MAYTPYYSGGWQSGEEGGTPITPAALNHMEDGISQSSADIAAYQGQNVIVDSPSSVSVSNDTVTDLATITITAGLWLIIAGTGWSASAAGWRMIDISGERDKKSMVAPVTGDQTTQQVSFFRKPTTSTTITLKGRQTSGATLTAYPYIRAVKIW